jgi:hypothetical protein
LQHLVLKLRSAQAFFVSFFAKKEIKATTIKIKEIFLELNNFENSAVYQVYTPCY